MPPWGVGGRYGCEITMVTRPCPPVFPYISVGYDKACFKCATLSITKGEARTPRLNKEYDYVEVT